jgi:hypothetical protein
LVKRTNTGSNIYVQTANGNVLLTKLNLNAANNRRSVVNVVAYYASQVGIIFQIKGSDVNKGKGIVGLGWGTEDPDRNPAYTVVESKDILINKKGNKISKDLFDYYNLENVLLHEKGRKINIENKKIENLQTHIDVYLGAIKDETFRKGTEDFQGG